MRTQKYICFVFVTSLLIIISCNNQENKVKAIVDRDIEYLNTKPGIKYSGSTACKECHSEIYTAYQKTAKAKSMAKMTTYNIIEKFPHKKAVYDSSRNFYYQMIRKDSAFFQREFRLDPEGNIIHEQWLEAQFTMGSGDNLRMYFYSDNGIFLQLPLTWYVHEQKWKMSPGYSEFYNARFSRFVTEKCFSCHNAKMNLSLKANDHYLEPFNLGIDCESCHGPGELHVSEHQTKTFDANRSTKKTIINPAKLSPKRQLDVCRQCHLQGQAWVLNKANAWNDYRPGMLLAENRSIFSDTKVHKEAFKVANTAYRLSLSRCFEESHGATTCINCHDTHGLKTDSKIGFNRNNCIRCHSFESLPGKKSSYEHKRNDDCIPCHMTKTGKENTLHGVVNTDHWIRINADKESIDWSHYQTPLEKQALTQLIPDLEIAENKASLQTGIAYLNYYKEEDPRSAYLDSSKKYLLSMLEQTDFSPQAYYNLGKAYLLENKNEKAISNFLKAKELKYSNESLYFNLGKAYLENMDYHRAINSLIRALDYKPEDPVYLQTLAKAYYEVKKIKKAISTFKKVLETDNLNPIANFNLGVIYALNLEDIKQSMPYFKRAVYLDPDIPNGYINLGNCYAALNDYNEAIKYYNKEIATRPESANAYQHLGNIFEMQKKYKKSLNAYKKALEFNPSLNYLNSKIEKLTTIK